jgi:DNA-binding transcriptional ArsR family regulator
MRGTMLTVSSMNVDNRPPRDPRKGAKAVRSKDLRRFILDHIERHSSDVGRVAAQQFGITRQAVNRHLQRLIDEGALMSEGKTRSRVYRLAKLGEWEQFYAREPSLAEDAVWRNDIATHLEALPDNVVTIWHYGFTEIFNNAIDHSNGTMISVSIAKTAIGTEMWVYDNGVGIFRKIQTALGLEDERHAVLELAKGKLTTDPAHHSGEGIFFSSRVFDEYLIGSGTVTFSHQHADDRDWIIERPPRPEGRGTIVRMYLRNDSTRTTKEVFDRFATSDQDLAFTKTVVPVRLAQYGNDQLVSRSQAKRLLARVDRFRTVMLDFEGVATIGQAFADETFRVFPGQHPNIQLYEINATPEVAAMIARARATEVS